jgi:ribokinase
LDGILINFEIPEPTVAAGVRLGEDQGVPVVVDAGPPRPYGPETWANCTVLTPNALETAKLVGYPVQDDVTAEQAARELLAAGPQAVVLKRGARGALLLTVEREVHVPAFPVEAIDTTGAGDAFSATLTVAVAEGLPLERAVRRANAAGALTVTRFGTMPAMPTRGEVDALLSEHKTIA